MIFVGLVSTYGSSDDKNTGPSTLSLSSGFAKNCAGCHGTNAERGVGERLVGLDDSISEFRSAVRHGKSSGMPSFIQSAFLPIALNCKSSIH